MTVLSAPPKSPRKDIFRYERKAFSHRKIQKHEALLAACFILYPAYASMAHLYLYGGMAVRRQLGACA